MKKSVRTHYDNLKVARSAPPEVVSAAYRALSKQLHPDKNPNDPNAAAFMRIVNAAYVVLSDPVKRAAHDQWIVEQENAGSPTGATGHSMPQTSSIERPDIVRKHLARFSWVYVLAGFALVAYVAGNSEPKPSGLPEYVANPSADVAEAAAATVPAEVASFVRPGSAPNGSNWPSRPAYVAGYPLSRADGLSKITIDNSTNSTEMFVKLVALDAEKSLPIRHAYIPAGATFTMNKIRAGEYDLRYMDLSDGSLSRSESFSIQEIEEIGGVRYSMMTMTLYKVANGNMQTYPLSEDEF